MLIKCPQCSSTNEVQKFCGNCGTKLFVDGVEINHDQDLELHPLIEPKSKPKQNKWLIGVGIFLAIWILGGVIVSIAAAYAGLTETYIPAITFFVGLIAMWEYVRNKNDIEIDETTIN